MNDGGTGRFRPGGRTVGGFASAASPLLAELMAAAGAEFVIVDLQHGEATMADLPGMIRAIDLHGATPLVRVPWCEPSAIMRSLDAGAEGIVVPMVEDAEQAGLAARATRYAPRGDRSFGPMRKARPVADANALIRCYPMVETPRGLDNVKEIMAVDGVDGVFIGPVDLGLCLGIPVPESYRHPDVMAAVETCVAAAAAHGKLVGTVSNGHDHEIALFDRGVSFISLGADKAFVTAGMTAALARWR
jgi:4-hydroxy-2-oxoheptanedioate aldolase